MIFKGGHSRQTTAKSFGFLLSTTLSLEVHRHFKNGGAFWMMMFTPTKIMVKLVITNRFPTKMVAVRWTSRGANPWFCFLQPFAVMLRPGDQHLFTTNTRWNSDSEAATCNISQSSGQFIINPYPNLRPFWGGFPY